MVLGSISLGPGVSSLSLGWPLLHASRLLHILGLSQFWQLTFSRGLGSQQHPKVPPSKSYLKTSLFTYPWPCWAFIAAGFSLVAVSGGYSLVVLCGLLIVAALGARVSVVTARGLIVTARGLSWSSACEIFPDQGSNQCLLHWRSDSLPLSHQKRPPRALCVVSTA